MWLKLLITFILLPITLWVYKPMRFYILSFFFEWLYHHKYIGRFLGISYKNDKDWKTTRNETYVYMSGLFVKSFTYFTGMEVILTDKTRKDFMTLQAQCARNIKMDEYFKKIENKTLTAAEFEDFLSESVLVETNRVFNILSKDKEHKLLKHILIVKHIINGLTGEMWNGLKSAFWNFRSVIEISLILRSVPEYQRILLFVPQLTLINNFSMMLAETRGNMSRIQPYEFVDAKVKFSVFVTDGRLVLLERVRDMANNEINRSFGPRDVQCPGNIYTIRFIKSILAFLQSFNITVAGTPILRGERFTNLINKNDVKFTFIKDENVVVDVNKWDVLANHSFEQQYDNIRHRTTASSPQVAASYTQ